MVPPTVLRAEGPAGPGSLQLYVDADPELHYYTFSDEDKERLRPVAMFDALINNADRKSGHILLAPDGHLWLIDHGLCFHAQDKLRTVVWDFVGEPIPEALLQTLQSFCARLSNPAFREALAEVLNEAELVALARRAERLIQQARFPEPGPGRPYPWPLV
jgi:uncharacterized repeat protein (TIGR03843 family)